MRVLLAVRGSAATLSSVGKRPVLPLIECRMPCVDMWIWYEHGRRRPRGGMLIEAGQQADLQQKKIERADPVRTRSAERKNRPHRDPVKNVLWLV